MGRIPIPTLIKAEMEAAGPYAQKHSFSRWRATYHITFAIISAGNELNAAIDAECLGCTFVQPTSHASHLSYGLSEWLYLCRGQRAEQSQTAYNAGTDCKYFTLHRLLNQKVGESIMIEAGRHRISYFDLMVCMHPSCMIMLYWQGRRVQERNGKSRSSRVRVNAEKYWDVAASTTEPIIRGGEVNFTFCALFVGYHAIICSDLWSLIFDAVNRTEMNKYIRSNHHC